MDELKRRKIWYVPGMISLVGLCFAFVYFVGKELKLRSACTLDIVVADAEDLNAPLNNVGHYFRPHIPKRNYIEIILTGHKLNDDIKLAFAQIRIREILSSNDSVNGVHFIFTDSARLGSFVTAIDLLRREKAKRYIPIDSNIWFCHVPPEPAGIRADLFLDCGSYYNLVVPQKSKWTKAKETMCHIWDTSWHMIMLSLTALTCLIFAKHFRTNP